MEEGEADTKQSLEEEENPCEDIKNNYIHDHDCFFPICPPEGLPEGPQRASRTAPQEISIRCGGLEEEGTPCWDITDKQQDLEEGDTPC